MTCTLGLGLVASFLYFLNRLDPEVSLLGSKTRGWGSALYFLRKAFGPFFFQIDVALGCDVAAGVLTSLLALKISRLGPLDLGLGCNNVAAGVLTSP